MAVKQIRWPKTCGGRFFAQHLITVFGHAKIQGRPHFFFPADTVSVNKMSVPCFATWRVKLAGAFIKREGKQPAHRQPMRKPGMS
jgi:hypothetical protein